MLAPGRTPAAVRATSAGAATGSAQPSTMPSAPSGTPIRAGSCHGLAPVARGSGWPWTSTGRPGAADRTAAATSRSIRRDASARTVSSTPAASSGSTAAPSAATRTR